ncbi:YTH domain-containing protein, partial [Cryomyces antarcticus]
GVRYFMIKSFNYDNVEASQRDGIWATQERNAAVLTEAFNTCRHVILCFSVNKSMGFQGYARMESPPGSAPTPTFVEKLFWSPSPPFYIRWLTVAETHFRKVGHLKNAYNENQAVLVGKDGQEIEEGCGMGLCELIDEEAERWLSGGF